MLSLVVETENTGDHHVIRLEHMIQALRNQTIPIEECDVIFMVKESEREVSEQVKHLLPSARIEVMPEPVGYGQMKMYGARMSQHPIVAFTDCDCIPARDWIEQILNNFRAAPEEIEILQGRTTCIDGPGADFFTTHIFGGPWNYEGEYHSMILNNFAARRSVFERYPFADLPLRQGVEFLMIHKLRQGGKKIRIVPQMRVTHNYCSGISTWFRRGQCEAFDIAEMTTRVMPLYSSPDVTRWRNRFHRLCLSYTQGLWRDLRLTLRLRQKFPAFGHSNLQVFTIAAVSLWTGAMVGFLKWRLGGLRPETPF